MFDTRGNYLTSEAARHEYRKKEVVDLPEVLQIKWNIKPLQMCAV